MFETKVVDKIKTHILCSIMFFRKSCRLWDNVGKYGTARQATDDNIIRRMRFACWITKATDARSEYVILISVPRQKGLRERASMLSYTYTACLVLPRHCSAPLTPRDGLMRPSGPHSRSGLFREETCVCVTVNPTPIFSRPADSLVTTPAELSRFVCPNNGNAFNQTLYS
jgi:hypothetical protein